MSYLHVSWETAADLVHCVGPHAKYVSVDPMVDGWMDVEYTIHAPIRIPRTIGPCTDHVHPRPDRTAIKRFLSREAQGNLDYGSGFGGDAEDGEYFDATFLEVGRSCRLCLGCIYVGGWL